MSSHSAPNLPRSCDVMFTIIGVFKGAQGTNAPIPAQFAFLPPANEVCEGYVFTGVCLSTRGHVWQGGVYGREVRMAGGVHGRGCSWQGACVAGGVHGRGHVWWGACMAGGVHGRGHACQGGVHGRGACMAGGVCGRGHVWQGRRAWQGVCVWQGGVHDRGHAWQGVCVAGGMHGRGACMAMGSVHSMHAPLTDTTRYGQWAGSTHPTEMHSCFHAIFGIFWPNYRLMPLLELASPSLKSLFRHWRC